MGITQIGLETVLVQQRDFQAGPPTSNHLQNIAHVNR